MFLKSLSLQNFRNYPKSEFSFSPQSTLVVGPNTSGKSNLLEAISFLSFGKSSKTEKDAEAIQFDKDFARLKGSITNNQDSLDLEVVITPMSKKYLVNGVAKRRVDFSSHVSCVIFSPADLDIIIGSPSLRRNFLDEALESVDREYRVALLEYTKALRQRNSLLDLVQKTGKRQTSQFEYWDELLIRHGNYLTKKRAEFITYINSKEKDIFNCTAVYDKSEISKERLLQYENAEVLSGVTLDGPHRDDFLVELGDKAQNLTHNAKKFGSRGQQRLVILQLKFIQMDFIEKGLGERPILLLDDVFSELDEGHIGVVLQIIDKQQTVTTTTHKELVPPKL